MNITAKNLNQFIEYCQKVQPYTQISIANFFKAVVTFPYDNELLLQAYVYLNINDIFPECRQLLLFEKSPVLNYTNLGKCDLVYFTEKDSLFLIETKYIDMQATGATARKRRNEHRNKVFEQVVDLKGSFSELWQLPVSLFNCGVVTTDSQLQNSCFPDVVSRAISIPTLKKWQQAYTSKI